MIRAPRISTSGIEKKRKTRSSRILLTGATGFLGSHIAVSLLEDGYQIYLLARSKRQVSAKERVDQLLDWFGVDSTLRKNIRVIEGQIEKPMLGLDAQTYADLLQTMDEIVHCASDTSFAERKRASVEAANVAGLENVLDLAAQSKCFFLHLVSTAYVAGKVTGPCPEALVNSRAFTNIYEETKCRGEWVAWERSREAGIRLSIYRPSIVYGHSETGRSLLFNALYYPVRTTLFLKNLYEADVRERGGQRAAEMGVRIESDGWTHMPIRMEVVSRGGINLVPVDYFVRAFRAIMEEALDGGIFHVVNSRLKKIEDIIEYTKRLFRIRGIEPCSTEKFERTSKNALEILLATYLEAYSPYIKDLRVFDTEKSGPILTGRKIVCPDFNYEIFSRCMNYAVETGWGAKLFQRRM
jgi:nucleoside-diphosphate-sugar epimerase